MALTSKLALGTAQWGLPYGIANRTGRPTPEHLSAILDAAQRAGISMLDTACAYGEAERLLGELGAVSKGFRIVTKTSQVRTNVIAEKDVLAVRTAFQESLRRLNSDRVDGLLVHLASDLLSAGGDHLWKLLQTLKQEGQAKRIGVSVYHPREARAILDRFAIDVIQLPSNIYDQRFIREGILEALKRSGVEVHVRSAFLQGLLLLSAPELPAHFKAIRGHHARLRGVLTDCGWTPLKASLMFCLRQQHIDKVVVGIEALPQLEEILQTVNCESAALPDLTDFALDDERVLDPSRWG